VIVLGRTLCPYPDVLVRAVEERSQAVIKTA
jgi:hypothetical protein